MYVKLTSSIKKPYNIVKPGFRMKPSILGIKRFARKLEWEKAKSMSTQLSYYSNIMILSPLIKNALML